MRSPILLLVLLTSTAHADELKLHLFRSPKGISWATPWKLTVSALKNQFAHVGNKRAFSISHVFVEVKCDSLQQHIFRGMTSATNTEERELIFKKKYGLGTLLHTFQGKLEKDEDIISDIQSYAGSSRRSEIGFKISSTTCERLLTYAQEFEERGYGTMYAGFHADPLKGEGAGCSAFAMSFLRVGGLVDTYMNEWKEIIDVPLRMIGGPTTNKKVPITYILSHPKARWNSREPHFHIEAWNPERMHSWVQRTYLEVQRGTYNGRWNPEISNEGETYKIMMDLSEVTTPEGPIWI